MAIEIKWISGAVMLILINIKSIESISKTMFPGCSRNGFTCITKPNKNIELTYSCANGLNDVSFYINDFAAPVNTESFKIENCNTLTLYTACTAGRKVIPKLHIVNIKLLIFTKVTQDPMLPANVVLENVSYVDSIPEKTFAQINKATYPRGCFQQNMDFQNIYFNNVSINTVERSAFVAIDKFKNFTFHNVAINQIRPGGIQLKHDFSSIFEMRNCTIKMMEYLAIEVTAKTAIFAGNYLSEISPFGFNATLENFYFTKNTVETLQAHALSVLSTNIFILDNKLLHLRSNALEKLSPGLLHYSGHNFGKLKFLFDFSKNELYYMEPAALHPDYVSYENVQTEMMFSRNTFLCTCQNLGWMFSPLSHGSESGQLEDFYKMLLDESYVNTCSSPAGTSCKIPLKSVSQLTKCGKCLKNVSIEKMCDDMKEKGESELSTVLFEAISEPNDVEELQSYTNNPSDSSRGGLKNFNIFVGIFELIVIRCVI